MIIGAFYLTDLVEGDTGEGRVFRRMDQIERALEAGEIGVHARIQYRGAEYPDLLETPANGNAAVCKDTTAGRLLFNRALPEGLPVRQHPGAQEGDDRRSSTGSRGLPRAEAATALDAIKSLCFNYAMRSGLTISINDVQTPTNKYDILDRHEIEADKVEKQFRRGIITDGERKQKEVEIWTTATSEVTKAMQAGHAVHPVQPHRHDGGLGCPREHDAGPPDRRHARPGGQPPW